MNETEAAEVPEGEDGKKAAEATESTESGTEGADQAKIQKLQEEVQQLQDRYLRTLADFENYKKRALKERSDLLKFQGEQIVTDLLVVADNMERAIQYQDADPAQVKSGLEMIYRSLCDVFSKWDIKAETAVGKAFDPTRHAAISKVPAHDVDPGQVVSELKKAYFYKDKMIRVGEVIVAVEPSKSE